MRKLNDKVHYTPNPTDLQHVTGRFFTEKLDLCKLKDEAVAAARIHEYTQKAFPGWTSLPLRSLNGMTGPEASDASGEHASTDPSKFQDTPVMQPYIREVIEKVLEGTTSDAGLLKVRLMKMNARTSVGEHRDNFRGDGSVARFHIPIVTHPRVVFRVEGVHYHLSEGELYKIDVSKRHAVENSSDIDRIHLVFDVKTDNVIRERLKI